METGQRDQTPRALSVLVLLIATCALLQVSQASVGAESVARFCSQPSLPVDEDAPVFKVRLGISSASVPPGGKLRIRIENLGVDVVTYGLAYFLETRRGGSWIDLRTGPFYAIPVNTESGRAGPCQKVEIRRTLTPGLYRISKKVWLAKSSPKRAKVVRSQFRIR